MKREIKFKAKRLDGKGWIYGSLWTTRYNSYIIEFIDEIIKAQNPISVNPETICQYIELKDKNGVEIYEFDLITCIWSTPDGYSSHEGYVKYDSLNTKFYSHSLNNEISRSMSGINESIEITGNKHD